MKLLRKIKQRYGDGLIINSIYAGLKQKKFEVHLFYLFQERLFDDYDLDIQPKIKPVEIELLKPSDMQTLSAKYERDYSEEKMLEMLAEGCKCMGVKYKDNIVSYEWYNLRKCENKWLSFCFNLKENEAYLYGIRTLNPYKGKALAFYLRYHTYKYLAKIGRIKLYSIVLFSNIPSIKFYRKLNAKPLKLFLHVNLFNKYIRNFHLKSYKN